MPLSQFNHSLQTFLLVAWICKIARAKFDLHFNRQGSLYQSGVDVDRQRQKHLGTENVPLPIFHLTPVRVDHQLRF